MLYWYKTLYLDNPVINKIKAPLVVHVLHNHITHVTLPGQKGVTRESDSQKVHGENHVYNHVSHIMIMQNQVCFIVLVS